FGPFASGMDSVSVPVTATSVAAISAVATSAVANLAATTLAGTTLAGTTLAGTTCVEPASTIARQRAGATVASRREFKLSSLLQFPSLRDDTNQPCDSAK